MDGLAMLRPLKVPKVYDYIFHKYIAVLTILFITCKILYKNDKILSSIIVYKLQINGKLSKKRKETIHSVNNKNKKIKSLAINGEYTDVIYQIMSCMKLEPKEKKMEQ